MNNKIKYQNCKFFTPSNSEDEGFCQRYPPQMWGFVSGYQEIATYGQSNFPEVGADSWCGEFQSKEKEDGVYWRTEFYEIYGKRMKDCFELRVLDDFLSEVEKLDLSLNDKIDFEYFAFQSLHPYSNFNFEDENE